jgi:hypothetical protein
MQKSPGRELLSVRGSRTPPPGNFCPTAPDEARETRGATGEADKK